MERRVSWAVVGVVLICFTSALWQKTEAKTERAEELVKKASGGPLMHKDELIEKASGGPVPHKEELVKKASGGPLMHKDELTEKAYGGPVLHRRNDEAEIISLMDLILQNIAKNTNDRKRR